MSDHSPILPVDFLKEKINSIVGRGTVHEGNITTVDGILVLGEVVGDVEVTSGTTVIAEGAVVTGSISGKRIVIAGRILGNVTAEKVELLGTAEVCGDVLYQEICFMPEATIQGRLNKIR